MTQDQAELLRAKLARRKNKELLADALRKYPTWGDAYLMEHQRAEDACRLLLEIEGAILGYWTDLPQDVLQDLQSRIREFLQWWEFDAI